MIRVALAFYHGLRYHVSMNMRQKTEEKVFSFMEENHMVQHGDKIILGVSGGADSVCLLFLLLEYRKRTAFEMAVVHVNHGLRGRAAEEDARYVEDLCKQWKLPFYPVKGDVRSLATEEKCSEEDAGRRLRYRAFGQAAEKFGGTKIGVAHNSNDRAETMLLHLFRGSGLKGLCGMEPVRENIIRPLLCLEREEIEAYLQERNIPWCTDSTNGEDNYTRNRIRHHILPYAEEEISEKSVSHMCRTAELLSETEDYLRQQTAEAGKRCISGNRIDTETFKELHPVLQKRVLLAILENLSPTGKDIAAVHVQDVLTLFERRGNRSICLPFGIRFRRQYDEVIFGNGRESEQQKALPEFDFSEIFLKNREEVPRNEYTKWFDYDKIKESPVVRFRQTGDYLTISDGKGNVIHKSLKDYMITEKVPREMRDRIPVLAEGSHVLWLIGYRISEYYKIDRNTKRILQVKLIGDCADSGTEEKNG